MRHAFASLLIHEGRLSVVEIAAQLRHNPTVCLDTYAHVMAEARDGEHVSAEEQILHARTALLAAEQAGGWSRLALCARPRTISGCPSPPASAWPGR